MDGVILRQNRGASRLFHAFVAIPDALPVPLNMFSLLFDPRLMRPFILELGLATMRGLAMLRFTGEAEAVERRWRRARAYLLELYDGP